MKFLKSNYWILITSTILLLVILGFFYFETSIILRTLVIALGIIGLASIRKSPEIFVLLTFYLGLFDLYNIRYGLAIPLSLIILAVFGLTLITFILWLHFQKIIKNLNRDLLLLYLVTVGLISMELFLTMSFWPVDPKIKALVIVVIFYIICQTFYLYINNVLNSKKVIVFVLICLLILGAVLVFNLFFGI